MSGDDERRLTSLEEIRAIVGTPSAYTPAKVLDSLDAQAIEHVRRSPFLLLSTSDAEGRPDVSPKGDEPGFVVVEDERTLLIPERKGNRLIFSLQNLLANPRVGLLLLVPGTEETLRIQGTAELVTGAGLGERLSARGQPALFAIRVRIERAFFHCARAFKRARLWDAATWPEPMPVSFGRIMAPRVGGGEDVAQKIDAAVEKSYREDL